MNLDTLLSSKTKNLIFQIITLWKITVIKISKHWNMLFILNSCCYSQNVMSVCQCLKGRMSGLITRAYSRRILSSSVTIGKRLISQCLSPLVLHKDNHCTHFMEILWGLNELIHFSNLENYLADDKVKKFSVIILHIVIVINRWIW